MWDGPLITWQDHENSESPWFWVISICLIQSWNNYNNNDSAFHVLTLFTLSFVSHTSLNTTAIMCFSPNLLKNLLPHSAACWKTADLRWNGAICTNIAFCSAKTAIVVRHRWRECTIFRVHHKKKRKYSVQDCIAGLKGQKGGGSRGRGGG